MNINPTTLAIILALTAAFSSIAGVSITALFNYLNTRLTKQSEERRHQRELIIKAAIDNWKQATDIAMASPFVERINPLDSYIIHMIKFSELLVDDKVDSSNVTAKLAELRSFMDIVHSWLEKNATDRMPKARTE